MYKKVRFFNDVIKTIFHYYFKLILSQITYLAVLAIAILSIEAGIVKRSYSDQSVRGYLTEVNAKMRLLIILTITLIFKCFFMYREPVGGMKCAKKNFNNCSGANVQCGLIAGKLFSFI